MDPFPRKPAPRRFGPLAETTLRRVVDANRTVRQNTAVAGASMTVVELSRDLLAATAWASVTAFPPPGFPTQPAGRASDLG